MYHHNETYYSFIQMKKIEECYFLVSCKYISFNFASQRGLTDVTLPQDGQLLL